MSQQLWTQSDQRLGWMKTNHYMWENQSPGHWCTCCQIYLWYSMLPPVGKLGHWTVTVASAEPVMTKNVVITSGRSLPVHRREVTELSINTSPTKTNVSSFPEFCRTRSKFLILLKNNKNTQDEPVTTSTTNRPDSVATTLFHQEISTMTPYLFHLLSDRPSVTSVSIYSKPIRHCLGVILLKKYIVILIYYYSYDDLWRWLNLFEINL